MVGIINKQAEIRPVRNDGCAIATALHQGFPGAEVEAGGGIFALGIVATGSGALRLHDFLHGSRVISRHMHFIIRASLENEDQDTKGEKDSQGTVHR